jgi:hypothetical protein
MDTAETLKRLGKRHESAKADVVRAEAEVGSAKKRAVELKAECEERFGRTPKDLAAWAEEERAAIEAEVAAIAEKVGLAVDGGGGEEELEL